jgi:hypothetical protein
VETGPQEASVRDLCIAVGTFFNMGFQNLVICFVELAGSERYYLLEAQVIAVLKGSGMKFSPDKAIGAINRVFSHQTPMTDIAGEHVIDCGE